MQYKIITNTEFIYEFIYLYIYGENLLIGFNSFLLYLGNYSRSLVM